MHRERLQSFITNAVTLEVKKEMEQWGSKAAIKKFVGSLQATADQNEILLEEARIGLQNSSALSNLHTEVFPDPKQPFSRSRHANSTLDVHDDFNVELRAITLRDGNVSNAFPKNLRELFSYDGEHYRPPADPEYKMY